MEEIRRQTDSKMVIINVIEAEKVEKSNGYVQYFIIKDKKMEPVL